MSREKKKRMSKYRKANRVRQRENERSKNGTFFWENNTQYLLIIMKWVFEIRLIYVVSFSIFTIQTNHMEYPIIIIIIICTVAQTQFIERDYNFQWQRSGTQLLNFKSQGNGQNITQSHTEISDNIENVRCIDACDFDEKKKKLECVFVALCIWLCVSFLFYRIVVV